MSKCDHYKHGKNVELTHEISGVSATKSERKSVCIVARCHTNTRRAKALVAKEETTRFARGLSSPISLCLKAFSLLYMVALALVFIFGGFCGHFCMYGRMDVWCYLHSFCVFGAFSRTMLALASLLLSCHTSVCLGALLNATHTPHNAGPRAMSRNTRQAMLDGVDRKRK